MSSLRVVVFGATGNVGSAVVAHLARHPNVASIVGVARRRPYGHLLHIDSKVSWEIADLSTDLLDVVQAADAVVHLAWKIQPSRNETEMLATNVTGTRRLLEAVVEHGVAAFVYASSVGTYATGPKDRRVDESWSTAGIRSSTYSRHKAAVESMLDEFEDHNPSLRIVRMRTSLVFQRAASSEIHRLFFGPLLPWHLPRPLRFVPRLPRLLFQATHADDIAAAYVQAVVRDVSGAFNLAAEPALSPSGIAELVEGRTVPIPTAVARAAAKISYLMRLQPSEPGWLDMALQTPLLDSSRARDLLDWEPRHSSTDALAELLDGISDGAGGCSAPLHPRSEPSRLAPHD